MAKTKPRIKKKTSPAKTKPESPLPKEPTEYHKVWKTSIPKAELAELPMAVYGGKITVIDTPEAAAEAVERLLTSELIGFDTETKPSFKRGEKHSVALLQLANDTECFLFRLNKIGLPQCVSDLLENPDIPKIGVSIHDDFLVLRSKFQVNPDGFTDLQTYVKEFGIDDNSLSRINAIIFGQRISKGQRLSNWEAETLSAPQQEYAALDAVACIRIYRHLRSTGFDYKTSKYYREYEIPVPHARNE